MLGGRTARNAKPVDPTKCCARQGRKINGRDALAEEFLDQFAHAKDML
jgi:hypothetical protein